MLFSKQDFPSAHSRPHHTPRLLHNSTNDVPYFASKQTGLIKTAHACKTTMWSQPTWPHRLRMISDSICQCCHEIFLLFMQQRNGWNNSVQRNGYRKKKGQKYSLWRNYVKLGRGADTSEMWSVMSLRGHLNSDLTAWFCVLYGIHSNHVFPSHVWVKKLQHEQITEEAERMKYMSGFWVFGSGDSRWSDLSKRY